MDLPNRTRALKANLKRMYGLTLEQYEVLYERQRGVCAICSKAIVRAYNIDSAGQRGPKRHGARVDHDRACCPGNRSCGRCVRGLLCPQCVTGLGQLRHRADLLRLALEYVTRPRY